MEILKAWMQASGMGQAELARAVGTTRQAVNSWCIGRVTPGLYYSLAIQTLSKGAVPIETWLTGQQRLALKGMVAP